MRRTGTPNWSASEELLDGQFCLGRRIERVSSSMRNGGDVMDHAESYEHLMGAPAPLSWAASCVHQECTLHQLSPYIGKLKSIIARDLILQYSRPGQLVADMFCGSGTIPLEAARLGRRIFASDVSTYAVTLTKGKLYAPREAESALAEADRFLERAESRPMPDLRRIPRWIRTFFHPRTLKETIRLCELFRNERCHFLLASLLGILHHQRPGFLSYPSSHLVPYLRSNNFPKEVYPELYEYRSVASRLRAKITRALKRAPKIPVSTLVHDIRKASAESVNLPDGIDCVITSPPYMNALDYRRDNRLRLWFLGESRNERADRAFTTLSEFRKLTDGLAKRLGRKVRRGGYCIFIVGEQTFRGGECFPSETLAESFLRHASTFRLHAVIKDTIPNIRRSRRNVAGVKRENVLVFRKS